MKSTSNGTYPYDGSRTYGDVMANHDSSHWCASSPVPIELPADSNDRPFKGAQHIGIHTATPSSFNWCSLMVLGQSNASSTERMHTHNSRKIFFFLTTSCESRQLLSTFPSNWHPVHPISPVRVAAANHPVWFMLSSTPVFIRPTAITAPRLCSEQLKRVSL